jgi:hypothetical protein
MFDFSSAIKSWFWAVLQVFCCFPSYAQTKKGTEISCSGRLSTLPPAAATLPRAGAALPRARATLPRAGATLPPAGAWSGR